MKEPRRQVKIYLQRVSLPPPSPVLANIHLILAYDVPCIEDVSYTHQITVQCWASVAADCWFNVRQSSMTLTLHYCITGTSVFFAQARGIHTILFQC